MIYSTIDLEKIKEEHEYYSAEAGQYLSDSV
jgi:hypothetical protein